MTNADAVIEALIKVVILSFLIERALAVVFDMDTMDKRLRRDGKPLVAILVSIAACFVLQLDAVSPLGSTGAFLAAGSSVKWLGYLLTGLVVAGGSAGAVKLFQDVLGFRRSTRDQAKETERIESEAAKAQAEARLETAKAQIVTARSVIAGADARVAAAAYAGDSPEQQILVARMAERDLRLARGARPAAARAA